jgi:mRNA interferase MazF
VSPDELNQNLQTVIVAPMTTTIRAYPSRVQVTFAGKSCAVALDQIQTVDRARLRRKLGTLPSGSAREICDVLAEMFAWSG